MTSLNRTNRARRVTSALLVPLFLIATASIGSDTASAARRARSSAKKPAASSASKSKARPKKAGAYNPADETVEMFEAMEAGQIAVKLIPKDSSQGRVIIQNKTKKPLNVKLPEAFAATPVLAQMGMGGMGMGGMGGGGGGGGQGMGGGMGGGGGGFFNVPAEKEGNFKVQCMCLEHGKPEPRASMSYKISPIETFTKKPGVKELCRMLGYGKVNQRAAQVAAWRLNNGMSWEQLAGKRIKHADGSTEPYFTAEELQAGMALVNQALGEAEDDKDEKPRPSPGETAQANESSLSEVR